MDRKIQDVFYDKSNNIYVEDNYGIIYWYHDNLFYPFLSLMEDVKNCFMIGYNIFVHHGNTITQFDLSMSPIISEELWITKNIDDVCYHNGLNIIVTLEDGEIYVNFNVSMMEDDVEHNGSINRMSLSHKYQYINDKLFLSEYHKFEKIRIVDNFLMVYSNNKIDIFYLQPNDIELATNISAKQEIFDNINEINPIYNIFHMNDGSIISTDKQLCVHAYIFASLDDPIYLKQKVYILMKDGYLLCYYEKNKYHIIIDPLLKILPNDFHNTIPISDSQNFTTIKLLENNKINIINNLSTQLIFNDGKIYLIDNNQFIEILLKDDCIYYDHINVYLKQKVKNKFIIDTDITKSVFDQLLHIIPYIYRLNDETYHFEQINQDGTVISYGEGVTRHTFSMLRKEMDEHFKNNFSKCKPEDAFNIGKLLFFCNWEGREKFCNIHPYFFYLISSEFDNITLLKKFKGNDFNFYHQQYLKYCNDPKELVDLEIGIKNHNDYIKYLLVADLSEEQTKFYNLMVEGYYYFASRNKLSSLVGKLPITYFTNLLIADEYFNAIIDFLVDNDSISEYYFVQFKKIFTMLFNKLSNKEIAIFCQNVTGSQYYNGEISIILSYEDNSTYTDQIITNETITNDDNPLLENDSVSINMDANEYPDENLIYKISTCNAELIIYVEPTEENLTNILNALVVEDLTLKQ